MKAFPSKKIFMAGSWKGLGQVTGKPVQYKEMFELKVIKEEPAIVVNWQQFTKHAETDKGLHAENGFLKILPMQAPGTTGDQFKAELMLSHPFSVNEYYQDCIFDFDTDTLTAQALDASCFQRGPTAKGKAITGVKRVYKLAQEGQLEYEMHLGVDGGELNHHLSATLKLD